MAVNTRKYKADIRRVESELEAEKRRIKREIHGKGYFDPKAHENVDLRKLRRIQKKAEEIAILIDRELTKVLDANDYRRNTETQQLNNLKNEALAVDMGVHNFIVMEELNKKALLSSY